MSTLNLTRENLLISLLLMQAIPKKWVLDLKTFYNQDDPKFTGFVYSTINNLSREKITAEKDNHGEKMVVLNAKGWEHIPDRFKAKIPYQNKPKISQYSITNHNKFLFYFLLEYLGNYGTENVESVEMNRVFSYGEDLKPDLVIRNMGSDEIICLETDTGTESNKDIFDKILKYFLFIKNGFDGENIKAINLFFQLNPNTQSVNLFNPVQNENQKNRSWLKYFDDEVLSFKNKKNPNFSVPTKDVLEYLETSLIRFFSGRFAGGLHDYKQLNFKSLIENSRNLGRLEVKPRKNPEKTVYDKALQEKMNNAFK